MSAANDSLRTVPGEAPQQPEAAGPLGPGDRPTIKGPEAAPAPPLPLSAPAAVSGSRYEVVRFHAKGGLGEVHVAHDAELRREVALKRIQDQFTQDGPSRQRFLLEAEITARLEHPGVVPVYGLVQGEDGQPCYAMRFIEGETLRDAIQRFHDADKPGRDPGQRGLALRQLLGRFLAVCNTIAYAHSRGIIHRDLKPSNIMLGKYGETLVVDWGLAQSFARTEAQRNTGEKTLTPMTAGGDETTHPGLPLGTPAYMSPEQAAGRWSVVGPASDIYSLGATLYHLLTGCLPFESADVLEQVKQGDFPPPRQANRAVPRALEAVCLKAMALRPRDRYATALELAADIEHWLADEPVTVWREPWGVRARRWVGRNRVLVASGVAALSVAVVALSIAAVLLKREKDAVALQEQEARRQWDRAEKQSEQTAEAFFRLARLTAERGSQAEAVELSEQVRQMREQLARDHPDVPQYLADLAASQNHLGNLYEQTGRRGQAETAYREALALGDRLAREHPTFPGHAKILGAGHNNLGTLYHRTGRWDQAEASYRQAVALWEQLTREAPGVAEHQSDLAACHHNLGLLHSDTGKPALAEAAFQEALALGEQAAGRRPDVPRYQSNLVASYNSLANLYRGTGRLDQAEAAFQKALKRADRLTRDNPAVTAYSSLLAASQINLGELYGQMGQRRQAEAAFARAIDMGERLVLEHPEVTEYQSDLAISCNSLGNVHRRGGERAKAEAAYQRALELAERLTRDRPDRHRYRSLLATSHNNLGELYAQAGPRAQAEAAYHKALALRERLAREHPGVPEYQKNLAGSQLNLGDLGLALGDFPKAIDWYTRALGTLAANPKTVKQDVTTRYLGFGAVWGRGRALVRHGRHREAVADLELALERAEAPARTNVRLWLALALAGAGDHTRAAAEAAEAARQPQLPGGMLYNLACAYALASAAAGKDGRLAAADRDRLPVQYAERAVELLRRAQTAGHFKGPAAVEHVKKDADLAALRERKDFQKLLEEIAKK